MNKKSHHHFKGEMEHHKLRASHKESMISKKAQEATASMHEVKDSHQEGISRVRMRKGELEVGHHGSMSEGWIHSRNK